MKYEVEENDEVMNKSIDEAAEEEIFEDEEEIRNIDKVIRSEVPIIFVTGYRLNSKIAWAAGENHLYYKNAFNKTLNALGYKCVTDGCEGKIYVRDDGTAFRINQNHIEHGNHNDRFFGMHCVNLIKQRVLTIRRDENLAPEILFIFCGIIEYQRSSGVINDIPPLCSIFKRKFSSQNHDIKRNPKNTQHTNLTCS